MENQLGTFPDFRAEVPKPQLATLLDGRPAALASTVIAAATSKAALVLRREAASRATLFPLKLTLAQPPQVPLGRAAQAQTEVVVEVDGMEEGAALETWAAEAAQVMPFPLQS